MPSVEKHADQASRNKKLMQTSEFDPSTSEYTDWIITIAFYTAVHLVERELAKLPYHSKHHDDREECMFKYGGKLKSILTDYKTLKAASLKTRYRCRIFTTEETCEYLKYLQLIEETLDKVS